MPILLKLFNKTERKAVLSKEFMEASIILILKPDKNKKKKIENFKPLSLMNIDEIILNKILGKQKTTHHQKDHAT